ncbi:hypothetical protein Emed_007034 [Eimeria media]
MLPNRLFVDYSQLHTRFPSGVAPESEPLEQFQAAEDDLASEPSPRPGGIPGTPSTEAGSSPGSPPRADDHRRPWNEELEPPVRRRRLSPSVLFLVTPDAEAVAPGSPVRNSLAGLSRSRFGA